VRSIAAAENIPLDYLQKILARLAHKRMLQSKKGYSGGFALRVPPERVRLLDIMRVFNGLAAYERCACGLGMCSDDMPCGLHNTWKVLRARIMSYLAHNTIASLAAVNRQKRRLLSDHRRRGRSAYSAPPKEMRFRDLTGPHGGE